MSWNIATWQSGAMMSKRKNPLPAHYCFSSSITRLTVGRRNIQYSQIQLLLFANIPNKELQWHRKHSFPLTIYWIYCILQWIEDNKMDIQQLGDIQRNAVDPKYMTPVEATALIDNLYSKVQQSAQWMSSLNDKINRFDRVSNQEMHMINKLYRFLKSASSEMKENSDKGEKSISKDISLYMWYSKCDYVMYY